MTDATSQNQGQDKETAASEVDFVALRPGQTIGRYEIVSVLGQGGFGITYRARDSQLNRDVAIKEYLPSALAIRQDGVTVLPRSTKVADDFSWGRQRFVDEGRTLASLEHAPAIIQVFDFLETNGTAYIVMKLVPGDTLENRIRRGTLPPAEIDRILWPLLDGLERVHGTGFLHRDIKPANILLDAGGNPTLIDFGASRAAMAGRTSAMTAIFTPGYAAAEQMTSAKQGPWTDIYGVAATMYHAIAGVAPPSAFDRMLDDEYQPLTKLAPAGFSPGLLIGIDAGLSVRASDRPQSIAGWRSILGQANALDAQATVALGRSGGANATVVVRQPTITPTTAPTSEAAAPAAKRGVGLWVGIAAAIVALAGGGYYFATRPAGPDPVAIEAAKQQQQQAEAEAAKRKALENDLAKLQGEKAERERLEHDAVLKKQVEEETRKRFEAELAAKQKAEEEARAKAAAEEGERQKTDEAAHKAAEATEAGLKLTTVDRQHIQVALAALGFSTGATDGVFGQHTRDTIAAWQKSRSYPPSGFVTGPQNQALLRDAAPAIAKFDDDQKKAEDARKKLEEEKAKAAAAAAPPTPQTAATPPPARTGAAPQQAAAVPLGPGPDGVWQGTMHCTPSRGGGDFTMRLTMTVQGGSGTWLRPGAAEGGVYSISMSFSGRNVVVSRVFEPGNRAGMRQTATMPAIYDGNHTVTGSGPEKNGGGRVCEISMQRTR